MKKAGHTAKAAGSAIGAQDASAQSSVETVTRADVAFQPLNPARGDAAPQAGVLWGDITKDMPTGTLVVFKPDFSSPPHIHNITYRGIVIEGKVHNDDKMAENMWMGPGSFWTQPAGASHITAAGPEGATIFLEIMSGPYLVQPEDEAFHNDEQPVNLAGSNVVWLDTSDATWIDSDASGQAEIAYLWGSPKAGEAGGSLVKMPANFTGTLQAVGADFKGVVIKGAVTHSVAGLSEEQTLETGSYFGSKGEVTHNLSCSGEGECLIYVSATQKYTLSGPS